MSVWDRLLTLTSSSPFTGTWMSLATAFGATVAVIMLRRMLPPEDRHHGSATLVFLTIGFLLACVRLVLVAAGADTATVGKVISILTTFFVAMGAINTALLLLLEVVPARTRVHPPAILRDLVQMLAFIVVVFGALGQAGVANFTSLITTSAVLTAVVGLALQSTIANLFAGIVLHMDRQALGVGDWVQVGERTGRITYIRWRSTILRTVDGDTVIIPNGALTAQDVHNYSRPSTRHRIMLKVGFHYRHPPNEVREVLKLAAHAAPGVLDQPPPDAFPVDFGDSAVVYGLRFWIDDFSRRMDIEGEVRTRLWYAARRAGLEIPYPIRTFIQAADEGSKVITDRDVTEKLSALEGVDLFAGLTLEERQLLARGMRKVQFAAGETIIRQGEEGDSLFVISRGDVVISIGQAGMHHSVTTIHAGNFFGEMSLVTGERRSATCAARTDVVAYVIDHDAFQQLLTVRPHIADQMSTMLATRQAALDRKGGELDARAAQASESKKKLLERIRSFFELT